MCHLLAETRENPQPAPNFGGFLFKKNAYRETLADFELSRKELDEETGFYYYGARKTEYRRKSGADHYKSDSKTEREGINAQPMYQLDRACKIMEV
jgi:hypothetical protein